MPILTRPGRIYTDEDRPPGAHDHREPHTQADRPALRAIQTASASPMLAIKAP